MAALLKFSCFFLLFNVNTFFTIRTNLVQANFFTSAEYPSNVFTQPIRDIIEATSKFNCFKPLTFYTALDETCLVNQTTTSLNAKILNPITVATLSGGVFGDDLYQLHEFLFYWQVGVCNVTHNLEARVYYFNLKYGSFEKALGYSDGVTVINFPIATDGDIPNRKFTAFSKIIQQKINEPGDYAKVKSAFTYTWFVNFPFGSVYHTRKKGFIDSQTGIKYTAVVIDLPLDPRLNFISSQQFQDTFGKITGLSGGFSAEDFIQSSTDALTKRQKGIVVLYIPA